MDIIETTCEIEQIEVTAEIMKTESKIMETVVMQSVILKNELQIGNFVFADLYKDNFILIESICSINKDIFNSTTGEIPFHSLTPITINEDLLKKINFQLIKNNTYYINSCFSIDFEGHLFYRSDYVGINLCYLHRLQNFFKLLKRDLTIA